MTVRGYDRVLATTAVEIWEANHGDANQPQSVTVQNNQAIVVTVGGSDVADGSKGIKLPDGSTTPTSVSIPMFQGEKLYAVSASGTPTVQLLVTRA